ncbi:MAG: response regulator [Opitutaceae bacterium]|jgi:PAS domain S-box-containing protein|nr:response regulator [Opitutaceae bacterium]
MNRVLIVDDKEDNLYYLRTLLGAHGFAVETAHHGAEALVKARQNPPDLVVSDLLMPVMDGYTLLRYWKADHALQHAPFIVYTATYTDAEDERLALDLGADAFILKPAAPEDFLARIRDVQAGRRAPLPPPSAPDAEDEQARLKTYSETLIRKLEKKTTELETANRALQADIARREAIEASLRESEQRFRLFAETIQEVFWLFDPATDRVIYVNPAYEKIWGRPSSAIIASRDEWITSIHPDDRARLILASRTKQASGKFDEIYRIVRPDGQIRWIHDRAFPSDQPPLRIIGIAEDITERRLAEERIREQAALLDQTQDAIVVRDLDHRVRYWNKGAEKIYGWTAAEAIGRPVGELIYRNLDQLESLTRIVLRDGGWIGEVEHLTKSHASLTVSCSWTLLRDETGAPKSVLSVNTDITERKKIEAQFLRAQRLESIGTLAGGISHDLNNLLSPILMGVELLKQKDGDESTQRVVGIIERSARRGTDLVKQVLSFARGIEGARVTVHLGHIVREIEHIARNTFPKNITFIRDIPKELPLVSGDPTQLNQVILNICVNARDAMPRGGRLTVSAQAADIDEQYAAAMNRTVNPGRYVVLEISDEGTGMSREVLDHVFEPFFTTKDPGKGTGLGLSTSLGIVRSHGGFITVSSEVGKGSVFKIHLPALPEDKQSSEPRGPEVELPRGHGELILVVDDESAIIEITRQTLGAFGYRVLTAANGAEAMALFALQQQDIALILTDMMMPIMDGAALIPAILRIAPHARIIATSGVNASVDEAHTLKLGARRFIAKPYAAEQLLRLVADTLAT